MGLWEMMKLFVHHKESSQSWSNDCGVFTVLNPEKFITVSVFLLVSLKQKYQGWRKGSVSLKWFMMFIKSAWTLILPVKATDPSHRLLPSLALPLHPCSTSEPLKEPILPVGPSSHNRKTCCKRGCLRLKQHFTLSLGTHKQVGGMTRKWMYTHARRWTSTGRTRHSRECTVIVFRKARQQDTN